MLYSQAICLQIEFELCQIPPVTHLFKLWNDGISSPPPAKAKCILSEERTLDLESNMLIYNKHWRLAWAAIFKMGFI